MDRKTSTQTNKDIEMIIVYTNYIQRYKYLTVLEISLEISLTATDHPHCFKRKQIFMFGIHLKNKYKEKSAFVSEAILQKYQFFLETCF